MARKIRTIHDEGEDLTPYIDELRVDYPELCEDSLMEAALEGHAMSLDDERRNLDKEVDGEIVIIADLGLWNGRQTGFGTTRSNNIRDILYSHVNGCSECHWYSDGYNIRCDETHHDGTNHYTYRIVREGRDIERLKDKIINGEEITTAMINYYTRSLLPEVKPIYGW